MNGNERPAVSPAQVRPSAGAAAAVLAAVLFRAAGYADVRLPSVFGDNMVLQCDMPVQVWGMANAGEKVTVTLEGLGRASPNALASVTGSIGVQTTAGKYGRWIVQLPYQPAGALFRMTVAGKNTVAFENVAVGEVWVCSGQSNMWWTIELVKGIADVVAAANYPSLRFFSVVMVSREEARIEGDKALVSSPSVPGPVAVRYGWDDNPSCTLANSTGLPASPFRTDRWPGVTEGKYRPGN